MLLGVLGSGPVVGGDEEAVGALDEADVTHVGVESGSGVGIFGEGGEVVADEEFGSPGQTAIVGVAGADFGGAAVAVGAAEAAILQFDEGGGLELVCMIFTVLRCCHVRPRSVERQASMELFSTVPS